MNQGLTSTGSGKLVPQMSAHLRSSVERGQTHFLIGRVNLVIGQSQPQKERIDSQNLLEVSDNRNRSSLTHDNRGRPKARLSALIAAWAWEPVGDTQ